MFVHERDDMYGVDAAILMNPRAWEASGHVAGFTDPLEDGTRFNTMFKTSVGAGKEATTSYLRPETAGGMFVNFKNVVDSFHPKLPFGLAQIGKAFRNEIAPRDFIFRAREFEQMEIEYFVRSSEWEKSFDEWRKEVHRFNDAVGIAKERVHELDVPDNERAHYSKRTIDFEFDFPFGRKELYGLAYRTDFDLSAHEKTSGTELKYQDPETNEKFTPHVIEPSFGVDRTVLAVLSSAYIEDELGGEKRAYLKLKPTIAPVKAAVFPLLKNKPQLVEKAREIYAALKKEIPQIVWDDNGNIGKRYRRQDEVGTPFCITVDFDTLENGTVTLRERDSGEQERVKISELSSLLAHKLRV
jgi:glycyl-tRNA synthetase